MIIGVDPGAKGGVAFISNSGNLVHAMSLPRNVATAYIEISTKIKTMEYDYFWIEKSQPHRQTKDHKEGITQIFSNGFNYGKIYGCLEILSSYNGELNEVYPITWKSAFKLSKDKELSMRACKFLYPESEKLIYGPKGGALDGIAEAILIAHYGYLQYKRRLVK